MSIQMILPGLEGPSTELTVERYFQPVGAVVEQGQPVVVVVSARYEWELPATNAGTIEQIVAPPGATVLAGAPLLELSPTHQAADDAVAMQTVVRATPVARRIASTHGLDLAAITGTGRGGRVTRGDVLQLVADAVGEGEIADTNGRYVGPPSTTARPAGGELARSQTTVEQPAPAAPANPARYGKQLTFSQQERRIPDPVTSTPTALTALEADLSAVLAFIQRHATRFARRGLQLDQLTCIAYACVETLAEHRRLNSTWSDDGVVLWSRIQLGVDKALADDGRHVANDAAALSLQGIARALGRGVGRPSQTLQTTFVISSSTHSRWSEGSWVAGHCPRLHIGTLEQRPLVVEQNQRDRLVIRPLTLLTLSYDARIVHQQEADAFLIALKERLEHFRAL